MTKTTTKGTIEPEGACLLTVLTLGYAYVKPCLPTVLKYSSLRSTAHRAQQAASQDAALHALRQQCTSEDSTSSFKSIT